MKNATEFRCPTCESEYKVVRVEATLSANEHPLTCLSCGAASVTAKASMC
jgi:transcription elongation factor Elf1